MKKACSKTLNPKLSTLSPKLGFTLIEVLIVMTIIGIIFGLGMAQYSKFNRSQIVVQAAQELKNNLRFAQNKAIAGEKDCSSAECGGADGICGTNDVGEKTLEGWRVNYSSGQNYQIYGSCDGETFRDRSIDLPSGVSPTPFSILFKPLGRGVVGATTITLSGFGETRRVSVSATGEIKYED